MIWLASYPRSGNTFFRNVLFEVYGIPSSTYHHESDYPVDPAYTQYAVVKTHLLPSQIEPRDESIPAVYLIRDGRDCVVSLAHYRQNLIDRHSKFRQNLREAIEAQAGSHFGGWSRHVEEWTKRASLVIRFEELIVDPIGCLEQLRPLLDLPAPRMDRLPAFDDLKSKDFRYGSGAEHGFSSDERQRWREAKFRRGEAGGWKDELPHDLHLHFLHHHGGQLERHGYIHSANGANSSDPATATVTTKQLREVPNSELPTVVPNRRSANRKPRVLIEGSKLLDRRIDGIHRYVRELLPALQEVVTSCEPEWEIDVSLGYLGVLPLSAVVDDLSLVTLGNRMVHPVLRDGEGNPLHRVAERIRALEQEGRRVPFRDHLQLRFHRLQRSLLKRLLALRQITSRSRRDHDVLHLTLPNTWQHFRRKPGNLVTTVHDLSHLICPETQTSSNIRTLAQGLEFAQDRGSTYLSVSYATQMQMTRELGIAEERITVVHNAVCSERFKPGYSPEEQQAIRAEYGISGDLMFLCLGTIEPRKNLLRTIQAFHLFRQQAPDLPVQLIIAGGKGWQQHAELEALIRAEPRIRYIGYVPDNDLPGLYASADVLCYPSVYEGFGLPIVEAMSCGTPAIYGDNSSMPEIADGCGVPVDALDPQGICEAMVRLAVDASLRRQLSIHSVLRAREFRWQHAAKRTLELYRHAMQAGRKVPHSTTARMNHDSQLGRDPQVVHPDRELSDAA